MRETMAGYTIRRLGTAALLLLLVLSFTFFFVRLAPGDPTLLTQDPRLGSQDRESLRRVYGLDRPLGQQYLTWMKSVLVNGDWGTSYVHQRPAANVIAERVPATLLLTGAALALQFGVGLMLGVAAAKRQGTTLDHLLRFSSLILYSLPLFWVGLMALMLLSHRWPLFPAGHMRSVGATDLPSSARFADLLHHLVLPVSVLVVGGAGVVARFARNSLLEVLNQDYIRTARAKGLSEHRVLWIHAMKNAAAPLIQLLGLSLPFLLSGSLVVEVVFSWPGLGRLTYDSILARDYPVIVATTALAGILVIVGNFLADVAQAVLDPRLRT
jgi:peptide/nickel transport system permease protein